MELSPEQNLQSFVLTHPRFQEKNLLKTRGELAREISHLDVSRDRRDYLLHLLSHAHTPEDVAELITQVIRR